MQIEYKKDIKEAQKQTEKVFKEYFDDFKFNGEFAMVYMSRKWYSLSNVAELYFYKDRLLITLTEENFEELKDRLQKFEDETKIGVSVTIK